MRPEGSVAMKKNLAWGVGALILLGCGDTSDGDGTGAVGGSRSGAGGAAGSGGGRAGAGGRGGAGADVDAGPGPGERDAGSAGGVAGSGGGSSVPPGCPEPTPIPAPDQVIGIQSVHFGRSEVVLRNVSNSPQTIVGGQNGWQWCNIPGYFNIVLADTDVVLEPDETYTFRLIERTGGTRPLYEGEDDADTNELGIYTVTGGFNNSELIEAFVSWGAGSSRETRESIASMALIWTYGERVTIEPGHAGFVATGDATRGAGFTSVPARCLPP